MGIQSLALVSGSYIHKKHSDDSVQIMQNYITRPTEKYREVYS